MRFIPADVGITTQNSSLVCHTVLEKVGRDLKLTSGQQARPSKEAKIAQVFKIVDV